MPIEEFPNVELTKILLRMDFLELYIPNAINLDVAAY